MESPRGDAEDEFRAFVAASGPRLLKFAVLVCGDRGDAEDLLQDGLERVWLRWSRLREQEPEAYARRTIVNRATSRWRSPWNSRRSGEDVESRQGAGEFGRADADDFGRADDRELVLAALRRLPPRMRAVIVLRFWLGYTESETAAQLGGSVGSVKSQASRGLRRLRADLKTSTGVADA
ncbi:SigE family RNA polymerase sigma factor [Nonomuraea gerenzanensis]|uniref:Putative RNA polymerase sigma factor n=1 Tax=Nonomuraea gerenzanensis TaxID=93944 RepID=A0A1M4E5I9_9ACTN|nr:SigE family RNA polymerase sigma factor [Nonomuraea gerenzanensis]UBU16239.1 SigE family RNA polymerase sigma factor [Nonomuraea gerenzanensis]SBO94053.1 putative RNA polymerase sigma factor [Nonomuraea gerenzanensis]